MAADIANPGVPNVDRLRQSGTGVLWGIVGGVGVVLGRSLLGPQLGPLVGAALAGAAVGGDSGKIIALNGAMDATYLTLGGGQAA